MEAEVLDDEVDNQTSGSEIGEDEQYTLVSYNNQPFIKHSLMSSSFCNTD